MAKGAPSKFKEAYCNEVIVYLGEGHTIAAFAGHVGVAASAVYEWRKKYPDFEAAYQIAKGKSLAFWENILIANAKGEIKGAPAVAIFGVKNRGKEYWRDVQNLEHTGKDGGAIKTQETSALDRLFSLIDSVAEREGKGGDPSRLN